MTPAADHSVPLSPGGMEGTERAAGLGGVEVADGGAAIDVIDSPRTPRSLDGALSKLQDADNAIDNEVETSQKHEDSRSGTALDPVEARLALGVHGRLAATSPVSTPSIGEGGGASVEDVAGRDVEEAGGVGEILRWAEPKA